MNVDVDERINVLRTSILYGAPYQVSINEIRSINIWTYKYNFYCIYTLNNNFNEQFILLSLHQYILRIFLKQNLHSLFMGKLSKSSPYLSNSLLMLQT